MNYGESKVPCNNHYLTQLANKYPEHSDILAYCIVERNDLMEHKIA
jgi:hypothetical protein